MKKIPRILAVDDDPTWLEQIAYILEEQAEVVTCETISEALIKLSDTFFDIALLDLNFEGEYRTGLDIFKCIAALDSQIDVVVITGETRMDRVFEVFNAGVKRVIPKPVTPAKLREEVASVLQERDIKRETLVRSQRGSALDMIIGKSEPIIRLKEDIQRAVNAGFKDILLVGETGTGKELVAKTIARLSSSNASLLPINCGALSDSLAESELFGHAKGSFTGANTDRASIFELASGGFVFLDEIGEMPLHQQTKLLRVIQERKVMRLGESKERICNFRTIAATHVDLDEAIKDESFRVDLYFRLSKAIIRVPSLRDCVEDIPRFVAHFSNDLSQKREFSPSALKTMMTYSWPGNIRQLQAVVESVCLSGDKGLVRDVDVHRVLSKSGIKQSIKSKSFLGVVGAELAAKERQKFMDAIMKCSGNKQKAAKLLGMSRATFYRRSSDLGI
jgi:two-component system response regulator PilR (NtrC family)